jgi:hypothetical protein
MKKTTQPTRASIFGIAAFFIVAITTAAQKPAPIAKPASRSVVFAVLDGGKRIEPIAVFDDGELVESAAEHLEPKDFANAHYKPKTVYKIVFGGAPAGNLTIIKSNIGTECGGESAETSAKPARAKLTEFVMALATNLKLEDNAASYRRRPTALERTEIEKLVRNEFVKQGIRKSAIKALRYHNLTAVDIDGDDTPEFVGSYWFAPTPKQRHTLFFISETSAEGKLALAVSDYAEIEGDDVMSGDVADVDTGIGHELLLDMLDYDNDGVKEVFTIRKAFEGNNYYIRKRSGGKWATVHRRYSYRCAY